MFQRVFWGIILGVFGVVVFIVPQIPRLIIIEVLLLMANSEMLGALRAYGLEPKGWPTYCFCVLLVPAHYMIGSGSFWALFVLIMMLTFCVRIFSKTMQTADVFHSLLPIIYPLAPFQFLLSSAALPSPLWRSVLITGIAVACLTDTMALFGGIAFGKRKLAPRISPQKTVEGALIGFAGGVATGFIVWLVQALWGATYPLWLYMLTAALASIAGQLGDLAASSIKREAEIKDFGRLIPGHGGVLDRLDSILFAVPVANILFTFFAA